MDEPACVLCGSGASELYFEMPGQFDASRSYRLMRCRDCRLIRLYDPLSHEALAALSGGYTQTIDDTLEAVRATWLGKAGLALIRRRRTPEDVAPGRLLDIGCSSGSYLAWMRSQGWTVTGIEWDPTAGEAARESLALDVTTGDAERILADGEPGRFDVVTLWHVLEHVRDPRRLLEQVRRALRPGGAVMLETPNAASLWTRCFGRFWFPWELPFHNFHFTPRSLAALLVETGFHAVRVKGVPAPAEILWSLDLAWRRAIGRTTTSRLRWNAGPAAAFYPAEWILAHVRLSNHLQARARV